MEDILTGQTTRHIIQEDDFYIHHKAQLAFQQLRQAAAKAGFDIGVASAFRSHQRQLAIWNKKAEQIKLFAILRWSAIPGASRHHWGSELDIYDRRTLPPGHIIQLTPEEVAGPFAPMHSWLDENLQRFGFFRPYEQNLGGVAPEPWHISYHPVSQVYFEQYDFKLFQKSIAHPQLQLAKQIQDHAQEIFDNYIRNIHEKYS